jgi:PAS domain S-box-containing protein
VLGDQDLLHEVSASVLARAASAVAVPFSVTDPGQPDNPLVYVNDAFCAVTGYDAAAVVGRNCRLLQGEGTNPGAVEQLHTAVREERAATVTLLNYRADGSPFWNQVSISPVRDAAGRVVNYVGVQDDVTARVQVEQERERAYAMARHAQGRLALVAEATSLLSATLDVHEALDLLARLVVPVLADWCAVDMVRGNGVERVAVAHVDAARVEALREVASLRPVRLDDAGPVPSVLRGGAPLLFTDVDDTLLAASSRSAEELELYRRVGITSGVVVPLVARRRILGTMTLGIVTTDRSYDEEGLALAVDLARRAGLAVDNARLYSEAQEAAITLQRSMLPSIPKVPGLDISAYFLPSSGTAAVGGDWYDVLPLPDGAIGLAIGDVMGHDMHAAAAMGQLRSVLRSYAWEGDSPAGVLDRLDRLVQGLQMAQLATTIYARLVPRDDAFVLTYANAGHLPPLVRTPTGNVFRLEGGHSPLIGAVEESAGNGEPRPEATLALTPGSVLLLYTDGLVEDRTLDLETELSRLEDILRRQLPGVAMSELCDTILTEMARRELLDDAAILLVRVMPHAL